MSRHNFTMTDATFIAAGRWIARLHISAIMCIVPEAGHTAESYLDAISVEAEKLEDGPAAGVAASEDNTRAVGDETLAEFEQELETRYRGSYLFYRKLPAKSREEVFLEHQQGASIEDVRKTILDRYLHNH